MRKSKIWTYAFRYSIYTLYHFFVFLSRTKNTKICFQENFTNRILIFQSKKTEQSILVSKSFCFYRRVERFRCHQLHTLFSIIFPSCFSALIYADDTISNLLSITSKLSSISPTIYLLGK